MADAPKQPITAVKDSQFGDLGNIVHVDVLPGTLLLQTYENFSLKKYLEGNHRVVLRQLDGTFTTFDITHEQFQLLHK